MSQGKHLERGSRLVDFDMRLGDAECVPASLADNQVDCRPPKNRPDRDANDTICADDSLSIKVCNPVVNRRIGLAGGACSPQRWRYVCTAYSTNFFLCRGKYMKC